MDNYQQMQFGMKKEEKSYYDLPKPRSIYKYELKATNEILKDTADLCRSALLSTAHTTRNHLEIPYDDMHSRRPRHKPPRGHDNLEGRTHDHKEADLSHYTPSNESLNPYFQEYQHAYKSSKRAYTANKKKEKSSQWEYLDRDAFINSEIYSFSEENFSCPPKKLEVMPNRNKPFLNKKIHTSQSKKDLKRQRRGLADISLKVKNIVAVIGRMTFKEVSDEVLRQSQDDLPNEPDQREKQSKNIRRRVYDALNVLVSVGILAKQHRYVVHTSFTNIRGKKLSEHYDIVAYRLRSLEQQLEAYRKKLDNLQLLKKNYQTLLVFQERNRKYDNEKREEITNESLFQRYGSSTCDRFYFPLIFLLPPNVMTHNIKIQIDYQDNNSHAIRKFVIEGTDYILTDLDTLKYLRLPPTEGIPETFYENDHFIEFMGRQDKDPISNNEVQFSKAMSLPDCDNIEDDEIYLSD